MVARLALQGTLTPGKLDAEVGLALENDNQMKTNEVRAAARAAAPKKKTVASQDDVQVRTTASSCFLCVCPLPCRLPPSQELGDRLEKAIEKSADKICGTLDKAIEKSADKICGTLDKAIEKSADKICGTLDTHLKALWTQRVGPRLGHSAFETAPWTQRLGTLDTAPWP